MKRVNPSTGVVFKRGDVREDGFVFCQYMASKGVKKDGYFTEAWLNPQSYDNVKNADLKQHRNKYNTLKGRAYNLYKGAINRSKKTSAKVTITPKWIENKIKTGKCEMTGLPFDLCPSSDFNKNPYSPSIDRIDSKNRDYTPKNTRIVLHAVNNTLNEYGLDVLRPILSALLKV